MTQESISLNKYISDTGICSRREADKLIEAGSVKINGKTFQIQIELYDDGTATYRVNSTKVKAGVVNVDKSLSEADLEAELEASLKKESPTPNQPNPAESSQTTNEATERDPEVPSNDDGTWRRLRVISFDSKFTDNPTKPNEFKIDTTSWKSNI